MAEPKWLPRLIGTARSTVSRYSVALSADVATRTIGEARSAARSGAARAASAAPWSNHRPSDRTIREFIDRLLSERQRVSGADRATMTNRIHRFGDGINGVVGNDLSIA